MDPSDLSFVMKVVINVGTHLVQLLKNFVAQSRRSLVKPHCLSLGFILSHRLGDALYCY